MDTEIARVVELLRSSRSLLFITGAGLSADSGLPTYRGIGGLYENRQTEENLPIEVLLSGDMLDIRPDLTWKYLAQIEQATRDTSPNRGHAVMAEMESHFARVWVLTQNVDGLHHRAGSRNVIDLHGDLRRLRCTRCRHGEVVPDYAGLTIPPKCPECRNVMRPDVTLFGERLPSRQMSTYLHELGRGFDLIFSVGTTSVFPYISAPVLDAHSAGRPCVEINPGRTDVSEFVTVKLSMRAAEALDAIWAAYQRG